MDFRYYESTLFDIKVKQKITITPVKYYIENWLNQTLIKIIEEGKTEVVGTDHVTATK